MSESTGTREAVAPPTAVRLTVVESPYAGNTPFNLAYLRACLRHCILRGEIPFSSHAIYTQPGILDDRDPAERELGIACGYAWWDAAQLIAVYTDLGTSPGMRRAITRAQNMGKPFQFRRLENWDAARFSDKAEGARQLPAATVVFLQGYDPSLLDAWAHCAYELAAGRAYTKLLAAGVDVDVRRLGAQHHAFLLDVRQVAHPVRHVTSGDAQALLVVAYATWFREHAEQ